MVMTGVDTMVSHRTTLQFYKAATTAIQELYDISLKGLQLQDKKVLPPPRVTVNKNNIGRVEDAILSAYKHDQSPNNPYHILKNADFYSVSFDGTSEYVKAVNASFFRVATSNGDIHTAPAELKEVHGSFNGEALANILLDVLGDMKSMENSAFDSVSSLLDDLIKAKENSVQRKVSVPPEVEVAALTREVLRLSQLGDLEYIPVLCSRQNYLKQTYGVTDEQRRAANVEGLTLLNYAKMPSSRGEPYMLTEISRNESFPLSSSDHITPPIKFFKQCKLLKIEGDTLYLLCCNWPTCLTGDGCYVNLKGCRILHSDWGLWAPFVRCQSHSADGSIKRMATSKTMCVPLVVNMAKNLKILLKHFINSPLHTGVLKEAMRALEMMPLHILNWASTRMSSLLTVSGVGKRRSGCVYPW